LKGERFGDLPGTVFRAAVAADAAAVTSLTRAVYARYVPGMGREPLTMSADHGAAIRDHQVWVLERDGALIASLELIPEDACLVVENVAVAGAQQGQGIGRRLMAFAEQEARRQGYGELRLYTNETMAENIGLYRSIGYAITEREPHRGTDIVHMRKTLCD
jgi:ribosomal protein S18 acetylase RimI-like enzyme